MNTLLLLLSVAGVLGVLLRIGRAGFRLLRVVPADGRAA